MAVWSVITFASLENKIRLEAEFYQPFYLRAYKEIYNCGFPIMRLNSLSKKITDGSHITPDYQEEGIRFLMVRDVGEEEIEFESSKFITQEFDERLKHCKPRAGDVLLTKVGSIGKAAVVPDNAPEFNIFVSLAVIKEIHGVDPYYLSTFLNSRLGRVQSFRQAKGITQPDLHLEEIREFLIPIPDETFQDSIKSLLLQVRQKRSQSVALYIEAENLLLEALGLDVLNLSHELTYERSFSDMEDASRYDAEYFQPKYQHAMMLMSQSGNHIKDVAQLSKERFEPQSNATFNYIEIGNLSGAGFAESEEISGDEAPSRAQWIVHKDDVITSTVRPIRRLSALIEKTQDGYVCSSGFAVLKPYNVEPELLLLYLRLPIICEVLNLFTAASMYPAISVTNLLELPITLPKGRLRQQIVNKVHESRRVLQDSKFLLEEAKSQVEKMIFGEM